MQSNVNRNPLFLASGIVQYEVIPVSPISFVDMTLGISSVYAFPSLAFSELPDACSKDFMNKTIH